MPDESELHRQALETIDLALAEPHRLRRQVLIAEAVRLHRRALDEAERRHARPPVRGRDAYRH